MIIICRSLITCWKTNFFDDLMLISNS